MQYRILMNEEKTKSVTIWRDGKVTYAERETNDDVWSPPIRLKEAKND